MSKGIAISQRAIHITYTVINMWRYSYRQNIESIFQHVYGATSIVHYATTCVRKASMQQAWCLFTSAVGVRGARTSGSPYIALAPASQFHSLFSPQLFSSLFRLRNPPSTLTSLEVHSAIQVRHHFPVSSRVRLPHHLSGGKRENCVCRPKDGHTMSPSHGCIAKFITCTGLRGMQTRSSDENSVCPSVTKRKKDLFRFFMSYERPFSLVFWEEEWWVGCDPFYLKFWVNRSPLERNRRFWTDNRS